jgi:hypothetical protein
VIKRSIYQQHISSIIHHHNEHKEHNMYLQFSFYYGLQSLGYQQKLNRDTIPQEHQLYNARLNLHNSTPTEKRNQSSTYTNISIGTQPVSSATCVCMRPTSITACVCTRPVCTTTYVFLLSIRVFFTCKLRSSTTFSHIHFFLSLSNLNHNQSQHIYALQLILLNHII